MLAGDEEVFSQPAIRGEPCLFDPFHFDGELAPGAYTLEARARHAGTDSGIFFDFGFQVRDTVLPVPETSTLLMLSTGVASLAASARRRESR